MIITRMDVQKLQDETGEGVMACFKALKEYGDHDLAVDYLKECGKLVSIKRKEAIMTNRERFEAAWCKKYAFEMKRGEGRNGYGLKMHDGLYISDKAQFAYEIWMMAITEG